HLDEEGNHAADGSQHHADTEAHEGVFNGQEVSAETLALLRNGNIAQKSQQGDGGPSVEQKRRLDCRPSVAGADIDVHLFRGIAKWGESLGGGCSAWHDAFPCSLPGLPPGITSDNKARCVCERLCLALDFPLR